MRKIKILYIVSTLERCAPIEQLFSRVSYLNKNLFEINILTISKENKDSKWRDFKRLNIKIDSLNLNRIAFFFTGEVLIKKYIMSYKPDLIHTTGIRANLIVTKLNISSKHCMTIESFIYEDFIYSYGKFIGNLMACIEKKNIKNCKYAVCCSKSIEKKYQKILLKPLYVIRNGVETNRFKPVPTLKEKNDLRLELNIEADKTIFISVGRLNKLKDPMTIIRAFRLANIGKRAILLFLGDGELLQECTNEVKSEDIIFKGKVKNVEKYLQASDVFISASKTEGLPNSVLEAAACGLNLILSDIPQHREIVVDSKGKIENVDFFDVGDVNTLSHKMQMFIGKDINTVNYELAKHIEENFSSKKMSENYEKLYQMILQNIEKS